MKFLRVPTTLQERAGRQPGIKIRRRRNGKEKRKKHTSPSIVHLFSEAGNIEKFGASLLLNKESNFF